MLDDRFLEGPAGYSGWWLWLGLGCVALVAMWFAAVVLLTLPPATLRGVPVVRDAHARLVRRRFAGAVQAVDARRCRGELTDAQACGEISRALRGFLHRATGEPAPYLQITEFRGPLAPAAPLLTELRDGRFGGRAADGLAGRTEELIRSWR